jgi:hypothetical protein
MLNRDAFIEKGHARIHGHFGPNKAPWPFASVYCSLAEKGSADISRFKAVEFMAKGDGKSYDLLIYLDSVTDFGHYRKPFQAPKEWTKIRLELKDFKQPDWGKPVPQDYRAVKEFLFAPSGMNDEDYDLSLDEIRLLAD